MRGREYMGGLGQPVDVVQVLREVGRICMIIARSAQRRSEAIYYRHGICRGNAVGAFPERGLARDLEAREVRAVDLVYHR